MGIVTEQFHGAGRRIGKVSINILKSFSLSWLKMNPCNPVFPYCEGIQSVTLRGRVIFKLNSFNAEATFVQSTRKQRLLKNHLNTVMWVFICKLSLSTIRRVPICHGFSDFAAFCNLFMLTKLEISSKRVNPCKLRVPLKKTSFVWMVLYLYAYLWKKHLFQKYLEENCGFHSGWYLSFSYIPKDAFSKEIPSKYSQAI